MSAPFIGPAWARNGEPFLVESLDKVKGRSKQRHLQRTRVVMDDFGNAVAYERCCVSCRVSQPLRFENYSPYVGDSLKMHNRCRDCSLLLNAARGRRDLETRRERQRARYRERMDSDPAFRERTLRKSAEHTQRRKEADPEAFNALRREAQKRMRERVKQDPQRAARVREAARIAARLRKERLSGISVTQLRKARVEMPRDHIPMVSAAVLAAALEKIIAREQFIARGDHDVREAVCERAGVAPRQVLAWRTGEIASVQFDTADRVITRLGLVWWDVFPDDTREAA